MASENTAESLQGGVIIGGVNDSVIDLRGATISVNSGSGPSGDSVYDQCTERELLAVYNDFTDERTQDKVLSTFKSLKTPEKQVNPQFIITEYYEGDTGLESDAYRPDYLSNGKAPPRRYAGEVIKLEELLDHVRYTALLASAGSGKTVALKRFAQLARKKEISYLRDVELVHYVSMAELDWEGEHTAFDLIFAQPMGSHLTNELKQFAFDWLKKNASRVLLVMDGVDQAPSVLQKKHAISYDCCAPACVAVHNVLNRDLFPGCRIVITSREHAVRHWSEDIRPQRTVAVAGLLPEHREYLIKELSGGSASKIWQHILTNSPGLFSLCENPAFLVFTTAVMVNNLKNCPDRMTAILMKVLQYFMCSKHLTEEDLENILTQLKRLAFNGMQEKKVLFKKSEITDLGLTPDQICDFVTVAPKKTEGHHFKLMERSMRFFFCHQTIQESLAALYICELPVHKFRKFVLEKFKDPHFEVVKKIVFGVTVDQTIDTSDIGEISEINEKRKILCGYLDHVLFERSNVLDQSGIFEDLPLCSLLHECGDGANEVIKSALSSLQSHEKLTAEGILVVSSVVRKCGKLHLAVFSTVCFGDWDVEGFSKAMEMCDSVQISVVKLSGFRRRESFECLKKLLNTSSVQNLIFSDCPLSEENFSCLVESSEDRPANQVESVDFSGNLNIEAAAFCHIGRFVAKMKSEDLQMNKCQLSADKLRKLNDSIGEECQVASLGLSSNVAMEPESLRFVGELAKKGSVKHLNISRSELAQEHLYYLSQGLIGYSGQFRRFDISRSETMNSEAFSHLGRIVALGKVVNLNISTCKLDEAKLRALICSSKGQRMKMRSLDVAWNGDTLHYSALGELVEAWNVEELICHGCFKQRKEVEDFISSLGHMREKVKITHGSEAIPSTTTSVFEFLQKVGGN